MSGVCGADRIDRNDISIVLEEYVKILSTLPGYIRFFVSGSYNSDKLSFGDIDLVVEFDSKLNKKELKQNLINIFNSMSDDIIVPFKSEKYNGKKSYNSGEIVTVQVKQPNGTVQIDNIISLSGRESRYKTEFLNLPAEKQGLISGLVKISDIIEVLKLLNLHFEYEYNEIVEFNISSVELSLRLIDVNTREKKKVIWTSNDWNDLRKILYNYNIDGSFDDMLNEVKSQNLHKKSLSRLVGVFKSLITVKSGEIGTDKEKSKNMNRYKMERLLDE